MMEKYQAILHAVMQIIEKTTLVNLNAHRVMKD